MGDTTRRATLIISAKDDASQQIGETSLKFTELNSAVELGKKAIETFKEAYDFAQQGAAIERIGEQWKATAQQFGVNADEVLKSIDKATNGTVDDEALMKIATRELTQNVVSNGQQLTDFFGIARAMTVRFGGDIVANSQAIDMAIETGMSRQLKAKGIVVDFTQAYKDYATQQGVTVASLDDETKLTIRRNEVLTQGDVLVKKVGDTGADAATKYEKFNRNITELTDSLKVLAADALTPVIDQLNRNIKLVNDTNNANVDQMVVLKDLIDVYGENSDVVNNYKVLLVQLGIIRAREDEGMHDNGLAALALTGDYQDLTAAVKDQTSAIDSSYDIAIKYTDQAKKMSDEQKKLADLDATISSQGAYHITIDQKKTLTGLDRALAEAKLSQALEDVKNVERKKSDTDADYAVRVAQAKDNVDKLTVSLGAHTIALGGATTKQLEERQAILDTITAMKEADVKQAGSEAFKTLNKLFDDGKLKAPEYESRMAMLNSTFGIFDQNQLATAIHTAEFQKILADPNSTAKDFQTALWGLKSATQGVDDTLKPIAAATLPHINKGLKDATGSVDNLSHNSLPFMSQASAEAHSKMQTNTDRTIGLMDNLTTAINTTASTDPSGESGGGKGGKVKGPIAGLQAILTQADHTIVKVSDLSTALINLPNIDRTIKYTVTFDGTLPSGSGLGGHAGGGTIRPGEVSTVGERGMELAIGGAHGTTIIPMSSNSKAGGGQTINIQNINLPGVQDSQAFVRQLNALLGNQARLAMAGGAGIMGS